MTAKHLSLDAVELAGRPNAPDSDTAAEMAFGAQGLHFSRLHRDDLVARHG
jgi:hypothetical protein